MDYTIHRIKLVDTILFSFTSQAISKGNLYRAIIFSKACVKPFPISRINGLDPRRTLRTLQFHMYMCGVRTNLYTAEYKYIGSLRYEKIYFANIRQQKKVNYLEAIMELWACVTLCKLTYYILLDGLASFLWLWLRVNQRERKSCCTCAILPITSTKPKPSFIRFVYVRLHFTMAFDYRFKSEVSWTSA